MNRLKDVYNEQLLFRILMVMLGAIFLLTACNSVDDIVPYGMRSSLEGAAVVLRLILGMVGLALLLAGFALYEMLVQIIGFLIGGVAGIIIGGLIASGSDMEWLGAIIGLLVGGSIGAGLALFLTYLGIFLSGAVGGAMLFSGIWAALFDSDPGAFVIILGAIIGGGVLIALFKFWITALTAAMGSILFGLSIGAGPGWWILFFLIGMAVQYGIAKVTGRQDQVKPGYQKPKPGN